jgi:hypothetical protein
MMRATLALALAAACQGGVEVIVYPPSAEEPVLGANGMPAKVDDVRLYVGIDKMGPVSIAPPAMSVDKPLYTGDVYTLDVNSAQHAHALPARFNFERGAVDHIGVLVGVGFIGTTPVASIATTMAVKLPSTGVDTIRIGLDAADALPLAQTTAAHLERVQAWGPDPTGEPICVFTESLDVGYKTFVVDANDVDCDGFPNMDAAECLPTVYQGTRGPNSLDNATCVLRVAAAGRSQCVIGGPPCIDGKGQSTDANAGCFASEYCAPAVDCDQCLANGAPATFDQLLQCVATMRGQLPTKIQFTSNGQTLTSPFAACPGTTAPVMVLATGTVGCSRHDVQVFDIATNTWQQGLVQGGVTYQFDIDDQCFLTITQSGAAATPPSVATLLAIGLASGRGLVIPLLIESNPTSNCTNGPGVVAVPPADPSDALVDSTHTGCIETKPLPGAEIHGG